MQHSRGRWLRSRLLGLALLLAFPAAHAAAPNPCAALLAFRIPGVALEIRKAEAVPVGPAPAIPYAPPIEATLPAHCRVEGVIEPRTGRNGRPYAIGFAVALPDEWNGRFLFQGGGGLNGMVAEPLGEVASGDTPALARGFAVVTTDSGFFEDQQAALNFLYQAIGKVTVVARQIVAQHYGKPAAHSYYVGCSTGGREAMMMSQRYPDYFDGIVAGAPAMRTGLSNLALRWAHVAFNQVAPRDEKGQPQGSLALSAGDRRLVVRALLAACDAGDGVTDGMIYNTRACGFDPAVLTCKGAKADDCLSAEQVAGPVGPSDVSMSMDVDAEARAAATATAAVGDTSEWTNLGSYSSRGGKLIFFHGLSDPWFSANDTARYYERVTADNGGADAAQLWSRLFLVPGMGHCRGGAMALDRFDLLSAIVDWTENGRAPDAVIATGHAFPGRSRPLCPYPKHAQYTGSGDTESAASFECRN
jgi:pimeloyl-ACP methyl ester carboxylesterase